MGFIWNLNIVRKIKEYAQLVMIQHTLFSLSFALVALLITSAQFLDWIRYGLILVVLFTARTGANGLNRVIDATIDAKNPRTRSRQIPSKLMSSKEALIFSIINLAIMLGACYLISPLVFALAPIALIFVIGYSYTKRWTWLCHFILGFTCSMAPAGVFLATSSYLPWVGVFMAGANMFWVSGFDIIYGSQDIEFDTAHQLHSVPQRFGLKNGLLIAQLSHVIAYVCFVAVGILVPGFGWIYGMGVIMVGALLVLEHQLIRIDYQKYILKSSYGLNQWISLLFLVVSLLDYML